VENTTLFAANYAGFVRFHHRAGFFKKASRCLKRLPKSSPEAPNN
jgi:hypothetical protein